MKRTRLTKFVLCAAGLLVLFGCAPSAPASNPTPAPCQMADLVAPEIITGVGPFSQPIIDTLRPTFEWIPTAYACEIQGYLVSVTAADGGGVSEQIDDGTTWAMEDPPADTCQPVSDCHLDGPGHPGLRVTGLVRTGGMRARRSPAGGPMADRLAEPSCGPPGPWPRQGRGTWV